MIGFNNLIHVGVKGGFQGERMKDAFPPVSPTKDHLKYMYLIPLMTNLSLNLFSMLLCDVSFLLICR